MKWKTMSGDVLDLKDMTDSHLANALRYEYRKRYHYSRACEHLEEEIRLRHLNNFMNQTLECPFCGKTMKMEEFIERNMEVGFCPDRSRFQFSCKCGAKSGRIDFPEYKSPLNMEIENAKPQVKTTYNDVDWDYDWRDF